MTYTLHQTPDSVLESLNLLEAFFNDETMSKMRAEMVEKYKGSVKEEDIDEYFTASVQLEAYVFKHIDTGLSGAWVNGRETAEFLYKKRTYTDNYPASVFYFYDLFNQRDRSGKLLAVLAYAAEDYFLDNDLESNPMILQDDTGIFKMIDEQVTDAVAKYEALKLYYDFDLLYTYNAQMVEQVTRLLNDKAPLFSERITRYLVRLEEELAKSGIAFLKEKYNLDLPENEAYDIRPQLYRTNSIGVAGSRFIKSQIHIGVDVLFLTDRLKDAQPYEHTLMEFVKALSDNTKLAILQSLRMQPCYGGQLAEKVGLTSATISYHMAALNKLELVTIKKEAVKVYFSLNIEKYNQYIDGLRTLI